MRPPVDSGGLAVRQQPDAGARTQAGSASNGGDEIAAATKAKACSKPGKKWVLCDGVREVVADVPAQ